MVIQCPQGKALPPKSLFLALGAGQLQCHTRNSVAVLKAPPSLLGLYFACVAGRLRNGPQTDPGVSARARVPECGPPDYNLV